MVSLVPLFGSLPDGGLGFVLNALFSVIPFLWLVAGGWFLLRRRARRTERNGRFARMVDAYDRAETDSDSQEK